MKKTEKNIKKVLIEEYYSKEKGIVYWNYRFNGGEWKKEKTYYKELPCQNGLAIYKNYLVLTRNTFLSQKRKVKNRVKKIHNLFNELEKIEMCSISLGEWFIRDNINILVEFIAKRCRESYNKGYLDGYGITNSNINTGEIIAKVYSKEILKRFKKHFKGNK